MVSRQILLSPTAPILVLGSICALVLVFGAARMTGDGQKARDGAQRMQSLTPQVENKTRSFQVTRARRNLDIEAGPELSLRNGYEKNITAFAVSVNGLITMSDFAYSENVDHRTIAAGAVYTSGFGTVRGRVNSPTAQDDFDIKVLAVLFDDKTSDGDDKGVVFLRDHRRKSKRILTSIIDLLNERLDPPQTIDDLGITDLKSRISSLSDNPDDASDINDVLRWLEQSHNGRAPREGIVSVKETCESLVGRL